MSGDARRRSGKQDGGGIAKVGSCLICKLRCRHWYQAQHGEKIISQDSFSIEVGLSWLLTRDPLEYRFIIMTETLRHCPLAIGGMLKQKQRVQAIGQQRATNKKTGNQSKLEFEHAA